MQNENITAAAENNPSAWHHSAIGQVLEFLNTTPSGLSDQEAGARNGVRRSIAGEKLVPGDIVILEAGDKVPADMRLLKAHGLSPMQSHSPPKR
jgi:hypothetical protein